jgi:ankyrin repeat protein
MLGEASHAATDLRGRTALMYAAGALLAAGSKRHVEVVRVLLAAGADRTATDVHGETALTLAGRYNYLEVCRILSEI